MDKSTAQGAHPAFVEIIKQLTPDEAKLVALFVNDVPLPVVNLRWEFKPDPEGKAGGKQVLVHYSRFGVQAGCEYPHMTPTYIDNLCRLGLTEVPTFWEYTTKCVYDVLENDPQVKAHKAAIEANPELQAVLEKKGCGFLNLGSSLHSLCTHPPCRMFISLLLLLLSRMCS